MVFDLLYVNGHSLMGRPLEERHAILWEIQPALQCDTVKLTEGFPAGRARRLMKACAMMGLEGVVMKRKASIYRPGFRTSDWLRVPIRHREEFVIGGYLPGPRQWRTLILGQYDREGKFVYAGICGTGLSADTRAVIFEELKATHRTSPSVAVGGRVRPVRSKGFRGAQCRVARADATQRPLVQGRDTWFGADGPGRGVGDADKGGRDNSRDRCMGGAPGCVLSHNDVFNGRVER